MAKKWIIHGDYMTVGWSSYLNKSQVINIKMSLTESVPHRAPSVSILLHVLASHMQQNMSKILVGSLMEFILKSKFAAKWAIIAYALVRPKYNRSADWSILVAAKHYVWYNMIGPSDYW